MYQKEEGKKKKQNILKLNHQELVLEEFA